MRDVCEVDQRHDYGGLAEMYDETRFRSRSGRVLDSVDHAVVSRMIQRAGPRWMVDVPVGTGRALGYAAGGGRRIVGVDYTEAMLAQAKERESVGLVGLARADAARLPFCDGTFDLLMSLRFFHLIAHPARVAFAREMARVVRVDGFILVSFTNGWYGGGLNLIRSALGRLRLVYVRRGEVDTLFPGFRIVERRGNVVPAQWRLEGIPGLAKGLRWAATRWPVREVCWEKYYLLQKVR